MTLAAQWPEGGPLKLWGLTLGEGYAGAAVRDGRVYVLDYDQKNQADVLRCLSLDDGKEIWSRSYTVDVKRNHGMSRTVPAVTDKYVVTLGPKCHMVCADAASGEFRWGIDLAREYRTKVPPWYAGQCPLIDRDRVILAPSGDSLMVAVDCATGKVVWKTPNPLRWDMTHSSIMPMEFGGKRMYVYCGSGGVVGVSADDGAILWQTNIWKVKIANVPSPVILDQGRILCSGGYDAGAMMLQLKQAGDKFQVEKVFELKAPMFGSEQQTPILYKDHFYGVIPGGQLVCMDLTGKRLWASGAGNKFGIGPYMIADGKILLLSDTGLLTMAEASPAAFRKLAQAQVIDKAHECWGPFALVGGRLIARDLTHMICLDLKEQAQ